MKSIDLVLLELAILTIQRIYLLPKPVTGKMFDNTRQAYVRKTIRKAKREDK